MGLVATALAIAPQRPVALIGSVTGTAQLWDLASRRPLSEVLHHGGPIVLVDLDDEASMGITLSLPLVGDQEAAELRAWNLRDSTPLTPPIPIPTPPDLHFSAANVQNGFLSLSADGGQALVVLGSSEAIRVELKPTASGLPPDVLALIGKALSGYEIDEASGRVRALEQPERQRRLQALASPTPPALEKGDGHAWHQWFLAAPDRRPIAPASPWTQDRYLRHLLEREDSSSLKRALALSPNHSRALAKLAKAVLAEETNPAAHALAAFYIKQAITRMAAPESAPPVEPRDSESSHGETYCTASEVCLQLATAAAREGREEDARHHSFGALQSAKAAYRLDPQDPESRYRLAQVYLHHGRSRPNQTEPSLAEAYLELSVLILALLHAEEPNASSFEETLDQARLARWPRDPSEALIPRQSIWQYHHGDSAEFPPEWASPDFDAASWTEGAAPIGYGEDDIQTFLNNHPLAVRLRHSFILTEAQEATTWLMELRYDDAAAVYLDGRLLHRENWLPDGTIPATRSVSDEREYVERALAVPPLQAGTHVLAAETRQIDADSSDLVIDLSIYPGTATLAGRLLELDLDAVETLTAQVADDLPEGWRDHWRFYQAAIADASDPLAQQPGSFFRRGLVQAFLGYRARALRAFEATLRLTGNQPEDPWFQRASRERDRLLALPSKGRQG